MADGVLFVNNAGLVTVCNDRAGELRGVTSKDILGHPITACHPDEVMPKAMRVINRLKEHPDETHSRIVKRGPRHFEIYYSAITNTDGLVLGVLAISREITEKVALTRRLTKASTTDELTKLYNHRHFVDTLKTEMTRAKRQKRPLGLLLFDLDKFKKVNDSAGHGAGDIALQAIGKITKKNIRKDIDRAFRYGGDEFTVILPETTLKETIQTGERLREAVEAAGLYGVTLSVGATVLSHDDDITEFIRAADTAMYKAKRGGGNAVYTAGDR